MKNAWLTGVLIGSVLAGSLWAQGTVAEVTHREFQAVNAAGELTYAATEMVTLEGIVLHNPGDMLDPTPDDGMTQMYNLAAEWQLFFQGEGDDVAGTAVYMGQMYSNLPWISPDGGYSNEEWVAEMARLNAAQFSVGDRIRATGYFLSYKGKNNINEQHSNDPQRDFTIELVEKGVGLPKPELVTLDDLKDDLDQFIFDPAREVGCERYQIRLIKIEGVSVVDPAGWGPHGTLTITDGVKTFPVKLGRGNGIYAGSYNLNETFDVIGILNQEGANLVDGYELYVVNYDGNGQVLAAPEHRLADRTDEVVEEPVEEEPVAE
ncbi:MAG: hypothetical protein QM570_14560 [Planctomycetota bacterium]|nr:hypothetical protein [Planctomycetota bacterium]